mgnify:FL=1
MSLPQLLIGSLEKAFNHYLSLDPRILPQLAELEGRVIAIELLGINETLYLFPDRDGVMILGDFDGAADTTLSGTPLAMSKLGLSDDAAGVLFSGEVVIRGDTRLGTRFKKILAQMDIDWEEQLSRYLGDVMAHQLGNLVRDMGAWVKRSRHSLNMDLGEYLQEESRLVPSNAELAKFIKDVDLLREGVDRLQARIERMKIGQS